MAAAKQRALLFLDDQGKRSLARLCARPAASHFDIRQTRRVAHSAAAGSRGPPEDPP